MIGVFDSGVGGLSILREIRARLPGTRLHYVADTAHLPYGTKDSVFVTERAHALTEFLLANGARAVVVACNTATAAAIASLRECFPTLPIVGVEPALKPAVRATRSGVVGVLATPGTLGSGKFARLISSHAGEARVLLQACPGWVEQVERGALDGPHTRDMVARQVTPLLAAGADTLVLGCTHFPFLRPVVQAIAGPTVEVLDTGAAVARELCRRLEAELGEFETEGGERFWTSGAPGPIGALVARLWDNPPALEALPATHAGRLSAACP